MRRAVVFAALLLLAAAHASAAGKEELVRKVVDTYGGAAAWSKVHAIRQSGHVTAAFRASTGKTVRVLQWPDKLRVDIDYGTWKEIRIVDGERGWRNDEPVFGPPKIAMELQAIRLAIPKLLAEAGSKVVDAGTMDCEAGTCRLLEVPIRPDEKLTVVIDPATGHVLRSFSLATGANGQLRFETAYSDFRKVGGLLFAFAEENFAQGQRTGSTTIDKVEVNPPLAEQTFVPGAREQGSIPNEPSLALAGLTR